jgi:hypothetical protein
MSEQNDSSKQPSEEELKERKQSLTKFYKEQLPLLRLQKEYEESITAIEIAKMTRMEIMIAKAQMMAPPPPEEGEEELMKKDNKPEEHIAPSGSKRSLKTEKQ